MLQLWWSPPCPSGNVQAGPRLGRGEPRVSGSEATEGTGGQEAGWGGREAARGSVSKSLRGWEGAGGQLCPRGWEAASRTEGPCSALVTVEVC